MPERRRNRSRQGCEIDMTPMIDVVFQLIIFFIVTLKIEQDVNPEIVLAEAKHGPAIEKEDPHRLVVEVSRQGWISIHGAQFTRPQLRNVMAARFRRYGPFPVLIRGDQFARHADIRSVMDICAEVGLWRISFAAIKEKKT